MDRDLNAPRTPGAAGRSRRLRWGLMLAAVLLVHGAGVSWLEQAMVGWGAGQTTALARIEVAFVRALAPAEPPAAVAPAPRRRAPTARATPSAPPASAPASAPSVSEPVIEPPSKPASDPVPAPADALEVLAAAPAAVPALPEAPPAPAAAAASMPAFEWPPSTRLTYALSGNYRGEVQGQARVQWVRVGPRYQVHLDVEIGPSFAPLLWRRMTSDGELGEAGLVPRRYDELTRLPLRSPRRITLLFGSGEVVLANGAPHQAPDTVQDTASQFVQLTWLFTTRPDLLRVGGSVEMPLALPRRVDRWHYDVVGQERLATPVGELDTFHLKPRRAEQRPRGELSAEIWIAPSLQYLPVRIRLEQGPEAYADLVMDAAPLQAEPPTR